MREGVLRDPRLGTPLGSIELFADAYDVSDKVKQLASSAHDEKGSSATVEAMHKQMVKRTSGTSAVSLWCLFRILMRSSQWAFPIGV